MKIYKKFSSTLILSLALSLSLSLSHRPVLAAEREISGELVILKTGNRQFRIVDHAGSFTAPEGVSLDDFDGKPVRVELGSNGRVLSITEKLIETNPMMRHYQIVTGQLVVTNPASGTFTISGDGRSFMAPVGVDVRPFANQMVDVFLDEQGQVKSIDRAKSSALPDSPSCSVGDATVASGSTICRSGVTYRCADGSWNDLGTACR